MSKKNPFLLRFLFILITSIGLGFFYVHSIIYSPLDQNDSSNRSFIIDSGSSLQEISSKLTEQGIISSPKIFYWYGRFNKLTPEIKAGVFQLNPGMTIPEIYQRIITNENIQLVVRILEGETAVDIDNKLTKMDLINQGEFIAAINDFIETDQYDFLQNIDNSLPIKLEGYLFPDTYFINPSNFQSTKFIHTLLQNFQKKALPLVQNQQRSIAEIINMASIVELEAFGASDAPMIADILWRRVDDRWNIGADATSLYLKESNEITAEMLQENSPYNTRKSRIGLPPGPIGNPGLTAIQATVSPKSNEYWYYLHDPAGNTHYALDYSGHQRNISNYLR